MNMALNCVLNLPDVRQKTGRPWYSNVQFSRSRFGGHFLGAKKRDREMQQGVSSWASFWGPLAPKVKAQNYKDTAVIRLVLTRWATVFITGACLQR